MNLMSADSSQPCLQSLPNDVYLPALVIMAATASIVVASVSRQENLSSRTRALTQEFRKIAIKSRITELDRERLFNLPMQICKFHDRLSRCVTAHLCLYCALLVETVGFGGVFVKGMLLDVSCNKLSFVSVAIVFAFLLLLIGLSFHISEYGNSYGTMNLETSDIVEYEKEMHRDMNAFLTKIRKSTDDRRSD